MCARIHVRHDDPIEAVRFQVLLHVEGGFSVRPIHGGMDGHPPIGLPQGIDAAKEPGGMLHQLDVQIPDVHGDFR